jgi:hypothetical protein
MAVLAAARTEAPSGAALLSAAPLDGARSEVVGRFSLANAVRRSGSFTFGPPEVHSIRGARIFGWPNVHDKPLWLNAHDHGRLLSRNEWAKEPSPWRSFARFEQADLATVPNNHGCAFRLMEAESERTDAIGSLVPPDGSGGAGSEAGRSSRPHRPWASPFASAISW